MSTWKITFVIPNSRINDWFKYLTELAEEYGKIHQKQYMFSFMELKQIYEDIITLRYTQTGLNPMNDFFKHINISIPEVSLITPTFSSIVEFENELKLESSDELQNSSYRVIDENKKYIELVSDLKCQSFYNNHSECYFVTCHVK